MKRTPLKRRTPLRSFSQLKGQSTLKRTRIKQRSKKRQREEAEYTRLRKVFLAAHPWCKPSLDKGKREPATEVHHMAGRGRFYLRVDTWLPVSASSHRQITDDRKWAESMGYSFTVEQRRKL